MGYESRSGSGMDELEALFGGPEPEPEIRKTAVDLAIEALQKAGLEAEKKTDHPPMLILGGSRIDDDSGIRVFHNAFHIVTHSEGGYLVRLSGPGQLATELRFDDIAGAVDAVLKARIPKDVRTWTKEQATFRLHQAELTYLYARGWQSLCGKPCKYMVRPGDTYQPGVTILYSHNEALKMQKEADGLFVNEGSLY